MDDNITSTIEAYFKTGHQKDTLRYVCYHYCATLICHGTVSLALNHS